MYRPSAFAVDDVAVLHAVMREHVFATIAMAKDGGAQFAYAPMVLDEGGQFGTLRFHLARGNPVCGAADGTRLSFSFMGANAYISPDWYENTATVPTWNYIAAEASGIARKMNREELRQLVIDVSAMEEEKLLPKKPWTIDKVPAPRVEALLNGIDGFVVPLETLQGKFKLSQNKAADIPGIIAGLEARGDAMSVAVVKAMRSNIDATV